MSRASCPMPRCGIEMIQDYLKVPGDTVYIQSLQSPEGSLLETLICPEKLARHDIPDEELDAFLERLAGGVS